MNTIIYIAGEGHSGSTLLDIILGSREGSFSCGELRFLPSKGIMERQLCACGQPVPDCAFWGQVISTWNTVRRMTLPDYTALQSKLLREKLPWKVGRLLSRDNSASADFLWDTEQLYQTIFRNANANTIIDSSKAPGMIPILQKLSFDLEIVHLKRRFKNVLASYKTTQVKNVAQGYEHDIRPQRTLRVLLAYLWKNAAVRIFRKQSKYSLIRYEKMVQDPEQALDSIANCDDNYRRLLRARGPFSPLHLVAGNALRMKQDIIIKAPSESRVDSLLSTSDKAIAAMVDMLES